MWSWSGGGDSDKNAEPAERIVALEHAEHAVGNARPANAVEAVAAGDEVAFDLLRPALMREADLRPLRRQLMHADAVDLEQQRPAVDQSLRHQILHHLLLAVDGDEFADQRLEFDAVQFAIDADIDAAVALTLALHARADADIDQKFGGPMLDQPGADAVLDVIAAAVLDDDGFDALQMQQPRQHQAGRPGSDNSDLSSHSTLPAARCAPIGAIHAAGKGTLPGKAWTNLIGSRAVTTARHSAALAPCRRGRRRRISLRDSVPRA